MDSPFLRFENIVRSAHRYTDERSEPVGGSHPFDERNIHSSLPKTVRNLFDDGYYSQATFEAFIFLENEMQRHSKLNRTGFPLMMESLSEKQSLVRLTPCSTLSETDEQKGYSFLFAGSVMAIRNPRGHIHSKVDSLDQCLDHLSLVSTLLRRLDEAGYHSIS